MLFLYYIMGITINSGFKNVMMLPTDRYFNTLKHIDDPNFSCYLLQNSSWNCVHDTFFKYDSDDSY